MTHRSEYQSASFGLKHFFRWLQGPLLACLVGGVLAITLLFSLPHLQSVTANRPETSGLPDAGWFTFANGDEARALLVDGRRLWVGSQDGGVVVWDVDNGSYQQFLRPQTPLAGNQVRDMVIDRAGNRWFATDRGLSVLAVDNQTWRSYTRASTHGRLPSDNITALAVGLDGSIWIGTGQYWDGASWSGGGVVRFNGQSWDGPYTTAHRLASNAVTDIAIDPVNGDVWVTTMPQRACVDDNRPCPLDGGGISVFNGSRWYTAAHSAPKSFPSVNSVRAVVIDQAQRKWFATCGGGLNVLEGSTQITDTIRGTWTQFASSVDKLPADHVLALALEEPDRVWVATALDCGLQTTGRGLARLAHQGTIQNTTDDEWRTFGVDQGLPSDLVSSLAVAGPDHLWVGTVDRVGEGNGVTELNVVSDTVRTLSMAERGGLPSNRITALNFAPDGHPWLGTAARGIAVLAGDHWIRYTTTNTEGRLPGNVIHDIEFDEQGWAWVATDATRYDRATLRWMDGGVATFDGVSWSVPYTLENTFSRGPAVTSAFGLVPRGSTFVPTNLASSQAANTLFADGYLMFEGDEKLYAYAGTITWTGRIWIGVAPSLPQDVLSGTLIYSVKPGLADNRTTAIAVGGGKVWVGTGALHDRWGGGLSTLDLESRKWETIKYPTLASNLVLDLAYEPEAQQLAVATSYAVPQATGGGLSILNLRDGTWTNYINSSGLKAYFNDVRSVASGKNGEVWAGAFNWNGSPNALPATWQGVDAVLNRFDGTWLQFTFPGDGYISSIALDAQGAVWAATSRDGRYPGDYGFQPTGYYAPTGGVKVVQGFQSYYLNVSNSGLVSDDVRVVAIDRENRRWFGTFRGLSIFRQPIRVYLPRIELSLSPQ